MNSSSIFSEQTSTKLKQSLRRLTRKFKKTEEETKNPENILEGIKDTSLEKGNKSVVLGQKREKTVEKEQKADKATVNK